MDLDIRLLGDKALARALNRLVDRTEKKIVNKAFRAAAKRLRPEIAAAVPVDTGNLQAALMKARIGVIKKGKGSAGIGIYLPTREELGIPQKGNSYYPASIEFGFTHVGGKVIPARPFTRSTVDSRREREFNLIAVDILKGIQAERVK